MKPKPQTKEILAITISLKDNVDLNYRIHAQDTIMQSFVFVF
jgi:hypothetical protein